MFTLSGDSLDAPFGTQHVQGTILDMSNPVLEFVVWRSTTYSIKDPAEPRGMIVRYIRYGQRD